MRFIMIIEREVRTMNYYIIYYANENRLGKTEVELTPKDVELLKQTFGRNAKAYRKINNLKELIIAKIFFKKC